MTVDGGGARARSLVCLGQCLPVRQDFGGEDGTYPFVARRYVEAARPGTRVHTTVVFYESPYVDLEFKSDLALRERPDVIVLEIPARPVAAPGKTPIDLGRFPRGVRTAYQRARYLRELQGRLRPAPGLDRLVQIVDVSLQAVLDGPLRSILRRYPAPTLAEYAALAETIVARLLAKSTATFVLAGPGGFSGGGPGNGYADDAGRVYDAVNEIVRCIAERHQLLFIDRVAVADAEGRPFFRPDSSIHYSPRGHEAMGRCLGDLLLKHGIV